MKSFFLRGICFFIVSSFIFASKHWQKQIVSVVVYPLLVFEVSCIKPLKNWLTSRRYGANIRSLLDDCEKKNQLLVAENIALAGQLEWYKSCHELIQFKKRYYENSSIMASVLVKNFSFQEHFFLVGAGLVHGVEKDMVAIYHNQLIGRVSEVYPWYCKLILITDKSCHVAALCVGSGAQGIHSGCNALESTNLDFVDHLDGPSVGDLVLSHGKGLVFPCGFALGKIKSCVRGNIHYYITLEPTVDFKKVEFCLLMKKND